MNELEPVTAYAWAIINPKGTWDLCYWASPSKKELVKRGRPSSEARAIKVRLVPVIGKEKAPGDNSPGADPAVG